MKKVMFLTKYPTPYRLEFFRQLGQKCNLTVYFEQSPQEQTHRNQKWFDKDYSNFKGVILKSKKIAGRIVSSEIISNLKKEKFDIVIIGGYALPTELIAIHWLKKNKINYYIEVDGILHYQCGLIKKIIKSYFIRGAYGYFSTGKLSDDELVRFGADRKKIIRYTFSSLKNEDVVDRCPTMIEKMRLRKELEINENSIIVYTANFIQIKGIDILLEAVNVLPRNIGFYIIGGVAKQEYLDYVNTNNLNNVHFINFLGKEELYKYYKAADCFVDTSRADVWGLVVNEAMANGLPVIGGDNVGAVLELVKNGENGYIFPTGDIESIAKNIIDFFSNEEKMLYLSQNSLKTIRKYTIENMVNIHIKQFGDEK